jgi:hypothetical protein
MMMMMMMMMGMMMRIRGRLSFLLEFTGGLQPE